MISKQTVDYLRQAVFIRNLEAESEREAINKMLDSLQGRPEVTDAEELRAAVFERQQTDPPLLPGGIAFPHARTNSVRSLVLVIATAEKPIMFGTMPVRLLFLIGVPKSAVSEYLQLTSFLARHLQRQELIEHLVQTDSVDGFLRAFADA